MKVVKGIHHVCMKCPGVEAMEKEAAFYTEVLGMEIARRWGAGEKSALTIDTGCGLIELFANGDDNTASGSIRHFALETDDVDLCVARVKEAGYPITVQPKDVVLSSQPPYPIRVAFCVGPMGEEIEFFQIRE